MKRAIRLLSSIIKNRTGAVVRPSWCTYLVCQMCNATCGMCDSWKLKRGRELSPEEVRTVFGKIGPLDVVRLSGGEPFLRKDMHELSHAVMEKSNPQVLHITTNGSYPDRVEAFVDGFRWPKRLRIMVSMDGVGETHDKNRGKHVTFDKALQTVETIKRKDNVGVTVSVNHTVISTQSLREAPELSRLLGAMGVDVQTVLAYSDSAMYGEQRIGGRAEDLIIAGGYPLHPDIDARAALDFVDAELARVDKIDDLAASYRQTLLPRGAQRALDRPFERAQPALHGAA
jgi:MoaA/NifB/PqqE/SkfB family radical SAM enzyme